MIPGATSKPSPTDHKPLNPWKVTRLKTLDLDRLASTCNTLDREGYEVGQLLPVLEGGNTVALLVFARHRKH